MNKSKQFNKTVILIHMDKYISLTELIKKCTDEKINLGKGDPYNRLRYYTKLGWLPFMERRKNKKNEIEGHYPTWVIETLKKIHILKENKHSKNEIDNIIKKFNDKKKTKEIIFKNYINKQNTIIFISSLLLLIVLLQIKFFNNKNTFTKFYSNNYLSNNIVIYKSGTGIITAGNNSVMIKTKDVPKNSIINVTFIEDIEPANKYYILVDEDNNSFTINTDKKVSKNVMFNYIITN